jgi:hypothetical protein
LQEFTAVMAGIFILCMACGMINIIRSCAAGVGEAPA